MNEVGSTHSGGAVALLQAIGQHGGRRTRRVLTAIAVGQTAARGLRAWFERGRADHQFTIAVPGDDVIYPDVHAWVLDHLPASRRRAMVARTSRVDVSSSAGERPVPSLRLFFDGARAQTVTIDGHAVRVEVEKPNWSSSHPGDELPAWRAAMERVTFTAPSAAGRDAVLDWLAQVATEQAKRQPRVRIATRWGGWAHRADVPARPLSSVVLRAGQRDRLLADMGAFLAAEADYARLGLPWHRGYLLHGVPGTGKTSIATALASALGLDVYCVQLGSLEHDGALTECLTVVESRSMLLLEDIDVAHSARDRDDTAGGVTLAGLLNALDGVVTPHGLMTVLTTNHRERLDPALLRPGRVDVSEELLVCDEAQVAEMCVALLGVQASVGLCRAVGRAAVTPADVVGVFKDHLDDVGLALDGLAQLVESRRQA